MSGRTVDDVEDLLAMLVRESDGFINATEICRRAGTQWCQFIQNKKTDTFIKELAIYLHVSEKSLYDSKAGRYGGTWVHPAIATRLAAGLSSAFSVRVSIWLEDLKKRDSTVASEYIVEISNLEADMSNQIETEVRHRLAISLDGQECVIGKFGEIDLVTSTEVIEIKFIKRWTHALGQALAHAKSIPGKVPRVHFFGHSEDFSPGILDHIKLLYDDFLVEITHEVIA
jgi:hypothetical protein